MRYSYRTHEVSQTEDTWVWKGTIGCLAAFLLGSCCWVSGAIGIIGMGGVDRAVHTPPPVAGRGVATGQNVGKRIVARVTQASGNTGVRPNQICDFVVQKTQLQGRAMCKADVQCGSALLYGGGTQGYFNCTWTPAGPTGTDAQMTTQDGDPAFAIDSARGLITVSDQAGGRLGPFSVVATVMTTP